MSQLRIGSLFSGAGLLDQLLQQTTLQGLASLETVPLVLAHGANGLAGDL